MLIQRCPVQELPWVLIVLFLIAMFCILPSVDQEAVYLGIMARCLKDESTVYCFYMAILLFDEWYYGDQCKKWTDFKWLTICTSVWVRAYDAWKIDILSNFMFGVYFGYISVWDKQVAQLLVNPFILSFGNIYMNYIFKCILLFNYASTMWRHIVKLEILKCISSAIWSYSS